MTDSKREAENNWREPTKTPKRFGFEWGNRLQVQRIGSFNGYHVLGLFTPAGRIELTITPNGKTIYWRRYDKNGKRSRAGKL